MEPFTLDREFLKKDVIDGFKSIIWTERYYGDSNVELVVPQTTDMLQKLPMGTFLGLDVSDEIMIMESINLEGNDIKYSGISVLSWMNNRFVRTSVKHEDKYWYIETTPGEILWSILYYMCVEGSPYLNGTIPTGISNPEKLAIPGLGLYDYDDTGSSVKVGVPYGPVYDAMREIATTYQLGIQIVLDPPTLGFRCYKGLDRTSSQIDHPTIRFSPQMDSLANIKELQSIAALKTLVYAFAPGLNPEEGGTDLRGAPGVSSLTGSQYTGFDLRALQLFADDVTTDMVGASAANLLEILNSRAKDALTTYKYVKTVDGEIVPDNMFQYGVHYNLGDIIEVQGNSGTIQEARVTEYIRSQDSAGIKEYPTVEAID